MPTLMQQPSDPIWSPRGKGLFVRQGQGYIEVQGLVRRGEAGEAAYVVSIPDHFTVSPSPPDTPWTIVWNIQTMEPDIQVDSVSFRSPQGLVYPSSDLPPGVNLMEAPFPPAQNQCQIWLMNQVTADDSFDYDLIVQISDLNGGPAVRAQVSTADSGDDPWNGSLIKDPTIVVTMEPMG